jgi:hypothetical protein
MTVSAMMVMRMAIKARVVPPMPKKGKIYCTHCKNYFPAKDNHNHFGDMAPIDHDF